jgi:regulator of sigma D
MVDIAIGYPPVSIGLKLQLGAQARGNTLFVGRWPQLRGQVHAEFNSPNASGTRALRDSLERITKLRLYAYCQKLVVR